MRVEMVDERDVESEDIGATFVVFVFRGSPGMDAGWRVDSFLLHDGDLPQVLEWLRDNVPEEACWSLGIASPAEEVPWPSGVSVQWIVGADVLNTPVEARTQLEYAVAEQMKARRGRITLP